LGVRSVTRLNGERAFLEFEKCLEMQKKSWRCRKKSPNGGKHGPIQVVLAQLIKNGHKEYKVLTH